MITSLREMTFYAAIRVAVAGNSDDLDARPSDAINLAVRVGAPILVDESVFDQCAVPISVMPAELEEAARRAGREPPAGTWRPLSADLLQSLYSAPW